MYLQWFLAIRTIWNMHIVDFIKIWHVSCRLSRKTFHFCSTCDKLHSLCSAFIFILCIICIHLTYTPFFCILIPLSILSTPCATSLQVQGPTGRCYFLYCTYVWFAGNVFIAFVDGRLRLWFLCISLEPSIALVCGFAPSRSLFTKCGRVGTLSRFY